MFRYPDLPKDLTFLTKFHRHASAPDLRECDDFEEQFVLRSTSSVSGNPISFWLIHEFDECLWMLTMVPGAGDKEEVVAWCNAPNHLRKDRVAEQLLFEWLRGTSRHQQSCCISGSECTFGLEIADVQSDAASRQESPLHEAAVINDVGLAKYLLSNGHPVEVRDNDRRTPLHDAVEHDSREVADFLVKHGARSDLRDSDGTLPIDLARENKNTLLASFLEKNEKDSIEVPDHDIFPDDIENRYSIESELNRAAAWFQREEYRAALYLFERAFRAEDATAVLLSNAIVGKAYCQVHLGQVGDLGKALRQMSNDRSLPDEARNRALFWFASQMSRLDCLDSAIEFFRIIDNSESTSGLTVAKARLRLAEWNYSLGEIQNSMNYLNAVLANDLLPSSIRAKALVKRGHIYYEEGDTLRAIDDFNQAINIDDLRPRLMANALIGRANCYEELGNARDVIADLSNAAEITGDTSTVAASLHNYGVRCNLRGQTDVAFEYFTAVGRFKCDNVWVATNALVNRGCYLGETKRYDSALVDFKLARSHPDIPRDVLARACYNMGHVRLLQGNFRAAIRHVSHVISMPDPPDEILTLALVARGRCWIGLEKPSKAVSDLSRSLTIPVSDQDAIADALLWSGICHHNLEDTYSAKRFFTRLIEMPTASQQMRIRAKWGLGDVVADEGDKATSKRLLLEAKNGMEEIGRSDLAKLIQNTISKHGL